MEYYKCYDKCYEFLLLINGDFNIPSKSFLLPIKHWEFYGDVIEWNFISQQPEMITMDPASLNSLLRTYAGVWWLQFVLGSILHDLNGDTTDRGPFLDLKNPASCGSL